MQLTRESTPEQVHTEWVRRLREPDRRQTTGILQSEHGQCCLGVLCEMAVEAGIVTTRERDSAADGLSFTEFVDEEATALTQQHATTMPTFRVAEWAGLPSPDPAVVGPPAPEMDDEDFEVHPDGTITASLASRNDSGTPFATIADLIESARWFRGVPTPKP